jgi:hypothetical protein
VLERRDTIGDARHRRAEERLEHHRAEADAERLAFVSERSREGARGNAEDDRGSFGGGCDAEDLRRGVRERLAFEGGPQRPADRPVVMNVRSELR